MSENSLTTLNNSLFDTLNQLKDGKMKPDQGKAIVQVANTIVNNTKVQLEAFKLMKGKVPVVLGVQGALEKPKDVYSQKMEFAQSLGYDSYSAAISILEKPVFERRFKEEYIQN